MFPKKEKKLFNKIVNQLNKNAKRNREEKYTIKYSNEDSPLRKVELEFIRNIGSEDDGNYMFSYIP